MAIGSPIAALRRSLNPTDDCVHQWWPIRLGWCSGGALSFFDWHGWQTGWESPACGARRVFGQTFHIGALKVKLGRGEREVDEYCAQKASPVSYTFKTSGVDDVRRAFTGLAVADKRGEK
jgi:hypothetical protein